MSDIAIDIQGVSKHFKLYHEKYTTLKERVLHAGKIPYEEFWALRDIEAQIHTGETVGILGRNGSGKSTLLKCIAGILQPSSGQIVVRGQLAAMLELGAGMQPELSGRDNVFLNGSLLGLSRREIARRFDEIVTFAELEDFIDNQVKYYSSGMYVRLGFAVAVNCDPDILLIDEVLAVGDERFQQKCMQRVKQFQREGRTIVFVSHSADLMRTICKRVIVIEHGEVVTIAQPGEAIGKFRETLLESSVSVKADAEATAAASADEAAEPGSGHDRRRIITGCQVLVPADLSRDHLYPNEQLELRVAFDVHEPLFGVVFGVKIFGATGGMLFSTDTQDADQIYDLPAGKGTVVIRFDSVPILDGAFAINVHLQDAGGGKVHDTAEEIARFRVVNPGRTVGLVSMSISAALELDGRSTPAGDAAAGNGHGELATAPATVDYDATAAMQLPGGGLHG